MNDTVNVLEVREICRHHVARWNVKVAMAR